MLLGAALRVLGACNGCARHPTSSCSRSSSATAASWPTPPAARRFYGAPATTPWSADKNGRGRRGRTPCSRTTPSSAWLPGQPRRRRSGARAARLDGRKVGEASSRRSSTRRARRGAVVRQRGAWRRCAQSRRHKERRGGRARVQSPTPWCPKVCDRRRRRLGLRHRLRRLDHVLAPAQCECPVLDTEVYSNTGGQTPRPRRARGRQVRGRGTQRAQKDLGLNRHELRRRLRGAGGHGCRRRPDRQGVRGGRGVPGRRSSCLQPLHRTGTTCATARTPGAGAKTVNGRSTLSPERVRAGEVGLKLAARRLGLAREYMQSRRASAPSRAAPSAPSSCSSWPRRRPGALAAARQLASRPGAGAEVRR